MRINMQDDALLCNIYVDFLSLSNVELRGCGRRIFTSFLHFLARFAPLFGAFSALFAFSEPFMLFLGIFYSFRLFVASSLPLSCFLAAALGWSGAFCAHFFGFFLSLGRALRRCAFMRLVLFSVCTWALLYTAASEQRGGCTCLGKSE